MILKPKPIKLHLIEKKAQLDVDFLEKAYIIYSVKVEKEKLNYVTSI